MKHRYLVMWHAVLGWGAPIPTLHKDRATVCGATGLTNQKIRKMGWIWCKVEFDTPTATDAVSELRRLDEMIADLQAERAERVAEMGPNYTDKEGAKPGAGDAQA